MYRRIRLCLLSLPALALLNACTPSSPADQADLSTCTAQADATYNAQNYEDLSRTSQTGLLYSATPNHVFDAQHLGAQHQRDDQIQNCLRNGSQANASGSANAIPAAPLVTPHIIN